MKRKFIVFTTILLSAAFLFGCTKSADSELLKAQYQEIISDRIVDFDNYMDSVIFFESSDSGYRMDIEFSKLPYYTFKPSGSSFFYFIENEKGERRIEVNSVRDFFLEDYLIYEEYNQFIILPDESDILMVYPLLNNDGVILMRWLDNRYDSTVSSYEELCRQEIIDWLDIISVSFIDKSILEQSPIETYPIGEPTKLMTTYLKGSTFF